MATILINAAQEEELRIAIVDENFRIRDLVFEYPEKEEKIHNIYKGIITGIETSLNAVFVNYGADKHGFLPIKDISPLSFYQHFEIESDQKKAAEDESMPAQTSEDENLHEVEQSQAPEGIPASPDGDYSKSELEVRIEDIKVGQEILVQVDKEERGNKGAALTGYLSLAGRYLVLMPGNAQAGGISRRVEGEDRDALRESLRNLNKPKDMGVIIRTSGVNKTQEELQWDLDMLIELWTAIKEAAKKDKAPFLVFQDSGIVSRVTRDYLVHDIQEVIFDDASLLEKFKEYFTFVRPKFLEKLVLYSEKLPIFSQYGIENQIDQVYQSSVRLASGGSLVINRTEALFSIDVNSARATRGSSIEETALQINLEAAEEIARQLRLRDIGGLIVIDFIDMSSIQHQKEVEMRLRNALRADRARVQVGRISRFGLLEMSRQRLRSSLSEETQVTCPRCKGEGHVRSVQSIALSILRVIEEDAIKGQITKIHLQVPVDMAAFFLNEKRKKLVEIEEKYQVKVIVLPNLNLHSPHYHIRREKTAEGEGRLVKSHETLEAYDEINLPKTGGQRKTIKQYNKPAVEFSVSRPAPTPTSEEAPGLLKRLFASVFGSSETKLKKEEMPAARERRYPSRNKGDFYQNQNRKMSPVKEGNDQTRRSSMGGSGQHRNKGRHYRGRNRKPMA